VAILFSAVGNFLMSYTSIFLSLNKIRNITLLTSQERLSWKLSEAIKVDFYTKMQGINTDTQGLGH
jgi:hypothetical protein